MQLLMLTLSKIYLSNTFPRYYHLFLTTFCYLFVLKIDCRAFERETIDVRLLDSEKVQFLIGDPSKHSFDIDTNLYNEVRGSCPSIQSSSNPRLTTLLPEDARNSDTCYSQW